MSLARYGLTKHPFKDVFRTTLKAPRDQDYFATVDGFAKAQDVLPAWFVAHGQADQPRFFVLRGNEKAGQSSVASYIEFLHLNSLTPRLRAQPAPIAPRLLTVTTTVTHESDPEIIQWWMSMLYKELNIHQIALLSDTKRELLQLAGIPPKDLPTTPMAFGEVMSHIVTGLSKIGVFVVAIFDKVKHESLYRFCEGVFYLGSPLIVFIEHNQIDRQGNLLSMSGGSNSGQTVWPAEEFGLSIDFGGLHPDETLTLIKHCWNAAYSPNPATPQPFDELYTVAFIGYAQTSIGLTVRTLEALLDHKLTRIAAQGPLWPQDQTLAITVEDIRDYLRTRRI